MVDRRKGRLTKIERKVIHESFLKSTKNLPSALREGVLKQEDEMIEMAKIAKATFKNPWKAVERMLELTER